MGQILIFLSYWFIFFMRLILGMTGLVRPGAIQKDHDYMDVHAFWCFHVLEYFPSLTNPLCQSAAAILL
jgi:hypothetical protein